MRLAYAIFTISTSLLAQEAVSTTALSESRFATRVFSAAGSLTLPASRVQLDVHRTDGHVDRGTLVVLHDPETRHYLWMYTPEARSGDTASLITALESEKCAVYAAPAELVSFCISGQLFFQEHTALADSLAGAEAQALDRMKRELPQLPGKAFPNAMHEVSIAREIGSTFFCGQFGDPGFTGLCRDTKILSVTRDGNSWRLVLRNHWDQEVKLGSKFDLISTRRIAERE